MSNARRILDALDRMLNMPVHLTLYGRAAIYLGFTEAPPEAATSMDVDVVLALGQAEQLLAAGNFWDAVEAVNEELAAEGLYISHFFEENQVILRPKWREHCVPIQGGWRLLNLDRLADEDLLLTKLMRNDPMDAADALFLCRIARLTPQDVEALIRVARVPNIPDVKAEFDRATRHLLERLA